MESCKKRALIIAGVVFVIALIALIAGVALTNTNTNTNTNTSSSGSGSGRVVDRCKLPKVVGPCKVALLSWYFDTQTADCEQFSYGGCDGNENRFSSKEECWSVCTSSYVTSSTSSYVTSSTSGSGSQMGTGAMEDQTITWARSMSPVQLCVTPGTTVIFDWTSGHNMLQVNQHSYESCTGFAKTSREAGPATWLAPSVSVNYFACGVPGHCSAGMKAMIEVKDVCPS